GLARTGHGDSDEPSEEAAYAADNMAGDVVRLLDHLDVPTASYLGYSMGGRIGLEVGLDFPDRVQRAVLGGIGAAGALDRADEIARAFRLGEPTDDPVARMFYNFASARPTNDLIALAACIKGLRPESRPERLAKIQTPILIAVADHDDIARGAPEPIDPIPTAPPGTTAAR